jgi:hypothetical protein
MRRRALSVVIQDKARALPTIKKERTKENKSRAPPRFARRARIPGVEIPVRAIDE